MSDITDLLDNLKNKDELSTAKYIATICLPEAIEPYLKALPLLSTDELYELATEGSCSATVQLHAARELLKRNPPAEQLIYTLSYPYVFWGAEEIIEHLIAHNPSPSKKVMKLLAECLRVRYGFDSSVDRSFLIPLGRYVLNHSRSLIQVLMVYLVAPQLKEEVEAHRCFSSNKAPNKKLLQFLLDSSRNYDGQEELSTIATLLASLPNLSLPVLALLASPMYGNQECWQRFCAYPGQREVKDFESILFFEEVIDAGITCYPDYFEEVVDSYCQLQPEIDRLGKLLYLFPDYSEGVIRHILSRQPTQEELINILLAHDDTPYQYPCIRSLTPAVCNLLGEYIMALPVPEEVAVCLVAAYSPSVADRAYLTLLRCAPTEDVFRFLIRLCGLHQKDAAYELLDRYGNDENAVLIAEYTPELAGLALEYVEHSAFEVLKSFREYDS